MKRDNMRFTRDILEALYINNYDYFRRNKEKNYGEKITNLNSKHIEITENVEISKDIEFVDYTIDQMHKLTKEINGDEKELHSMISELVENYSLEGRLFTGNKKAEFKKLHLDDKYMYFALREKTDDYGMPSRSDALFINARHGNNITSVQQVLEDNYIITITTYDPEKETLQKRISVYDKKASIDISNKTEEHGFYEPDLYREIEVIKTDYGLQLNDYEVLDKEFENKKCVGVYELETDRSMNEVAALYVKQLELEKLVEETIDFKQYRKQTKKHPRLTITMEPKKEQ